MCVRGWDVSEGNAGLRDTATLERRPTQRSGTPTGRERSGTPTRRSGVGSEGGCVKGTLELKSSTELARFAAKSAA